MISEGVSTNTYIDPELVPVKQVWITRFDSVVLIVDVICRCILLTMAWHSSML